MQAQQTRSTTQSITHTQSLTAVKTLLQAGLGAITYLRFFHSVSPCNINSLFLQGTYYPRTTFLQVCLSTPHFTANS